MNRSSDTLVPYSVSRQFLLAPVVVMLICPEPSPGTNSSNLKFSVSNAGVGLGATYGGAANGATAPIVSIFLNPIQSPFTWANRFQPGVTPPRHCENDVQ